MRQCVVSRAVSIADDAVSSTSQYPNYNMTHETTIQYIHCHIYSAIDHLSLFIGLLCFATYVVLIHCFLLVCLEVEVYEQAEEECCVYNEQDAEKPRKITL